MLDLVYCWLLGQADSDRVASVAQDRAVVALRRWIPRLTKAWWFRVMRNLERNGALRCESEGRRGVGGAARYRLLEGPPRSLHLPLESGEWVRAYEMRDNWPWILVPSPQKLEEIEVLRQLAAHGPVALWLDAHGMRARLLPQWKMP